MVDVTLHALVGVPASQIQIVQARIFFVQVHESVSRFQDGTIVGHRHAVDIGKHAGDLGQIAFALVIELVAFDERLNHHATRHDLAAFVNEDGPWSTTTRFERLERPELVGRLMRQVLLASVVRTQNELLARFGMHEPEVGVVLAIAQRVQLDCRCACAYAIPERAAAIYVALRLVKHTLLLCIHIYLLETAPKGSDPSGAVLQNRTRWV